MSSLIWIQTVWHFDGTNVLIKDLFEEVIFENNQKTTKPMEKYPAC